MQTAERQLQQYIWKIINWANTNGSRMCKNKTRKVDMPLNKEAQQKVWNPLPPPAMS